MLLRTAGARSPELLQTPTKTPLSKRHPNRLLLLWNDPCFDTHGADDLKEQLDSASEIEIIVEADSQDRSRSLSLRRHPTDKYMEAFRAFVKAVRELEPSSMAPFDPQTVEILMNDTRCDVRQKLKSSILHVERVFPRIGAFEVVLLWRQKRGHGVWKEALLYSKLHTERWPNVHALAEHLAGLVSSTQSPTTPPTMLLCNTSSDISQAETKLRMSEMIILEKEQVIKDKDEKIRALRQEITHKTGELRRVESEVNALADTLRRIETAYIRDFQYTDQNVENVKKQLMDLTKQLGFSMDSWDYFVRKSEQVNQCLQTTRTELERVTADLRRHKAELRKRSQETVKMEERHELDVNAIKDLELRNSHLASELERAQQALTGSEAARVNIATALQGREDTRMMLEEQARVVLEGLLHVQFDLQVVSAASADDYALLHRILAEPQPITRVAHRPAPIKAAPSRATEEWDSWQQEKDRVNVFWAVQQSDAVKAKMDERLHDSREQERQLREREQQLRHKEMLLEAAQSQGRSILEQVKQAVDELLVVHALLSQQNPAQKLAQQIKIHLNELYREFEGSRKELSSVQDDVRATCLRLSADLSAKKLETESWKTLAQELEAGRQVDKAARLVKPHLLQRGLWSPQGHLLAACSSDNKVLVWNVQTRSLKATLTGHSRAVCRIAWSPSGELLATCSLDMLVMIWNLTTGERVWTLRGHTGAVSGAAWNASGELLGSYSSDKTVVLWDANTGERVTTFKEHVAEVECAAWSPDGGRVASFGGLTIMVWDARTAARLRSMTCQGAPVCEIVWSAGGDLLASCSLDRTITVWGVEGGCSLAALAGHSGTVFSMAWNSKGSLLATYSDDGVVLIWSPQTGGLVWTLKGPRGEVHSVAWHADGVRILVCYLDRTLVVWDCRTGAQVLSVKAHGWSVYAVQWVGQLVRVVTADEGDAHFDGETGEAASPPAAGDAAGKRWVRAVAWDASGGRIASCSSERTVCVWDAESGALLSTLAGHTDWVRGVAWDPCGDRLASCSSDKTVLVWHAGTRRRATTLRGHTGAVTSVSWSPDGRRLASGSEDCTVVIWDPASRGYLPPLRGHSREVSCVQWSPGGDRLASSSVDETVLVWDTASGERLAVLRPSGYCGSVHGVCWDAPGGRLAACTADNTVVVWEPGDAAGGPVATLRGSGGSSKGGYCGALFGVSWERSGSRVAACCDDGTAVVWDVGTGEAAARLEGHRGVVLGVAWHPAGRRIATCSADGRLVVWDADTAALVWEREHHSPPTPRS